MTAERLLAQVERLLEQVDVAVALGDQPAAMRLMARARQAAYAARQAVDPAIADPMELELRHRATAVLLKPDPIAA